MILTIAGEPTRQFYRPRDASLVDFSLAHHALLVGVSPLRDDALGESANLTVTLDNRGRSLGSLFAVPPLGAAATLTTSAGTAFAGVVERVAIDGDECSIEVVA